MGCASSQVPVTNTHNHDKNIHVVHSDIKVHTVVSAELDFDHKTAMHIPLVSPKRGGLSLISICCNFSLDAPSYPSSPPDTQRAK